VALRLLKNGSGIFFSKFSQIHVRNADGKTFKDVAVAKFVKSFLISGLNPGTDYDVDFIALCQVSML